MRDRSFTVDLELKTTKCLLAAAEPDGGVCRSCRQPVPALVDGRCTSCVVNQGIDPLRIGPELVAAQ